MLNIIFLLISFHSKSKLSIFDAQSQDNQAEHKQMTFDGPKGNLGLEFWGVKILRSASLHADNFVALSLFYFRHYM